MMRLVRILPFVFILAACGKDKTADEYQREKAAQNQALYESVAGSYSGVVSSKETGAALGAMQLDLRADRVVSNPSNGDIAIGTPILVGNVRFLDETVSQLNAPLGSYDPATGLYNAEIKISRGGAEESVRIRGTITESGITGGTIEAAGSPELGGTFALQKNGESIQRLLERARPGWRPDPNGRSKVRSFLGETFFQSANATRPLHAVILQPLSGTPTDFLDLVSPLKTVDLSFNYSQSLRLLFANALYDRRQGLVTGSTTITYNNQSLRMSVECRVGESTLRCNHLTGSGVAARSSGQLNTGPTQDPPESPNDGISVTKTFAGKGKFLDDRPVTMKIVVTRPARSRIEDLMELFFPSSERPLHVVFQFTPDTQASFPNSRWNKLTGVVEGEFAGAGYIAYMQCFDFHFTGTRGPFHCKYWTTRSSVITIDFKPPYE